MRATLSSFKLPIILDCVCLASLVSAALTVGINKNSSTHSPTSYVNASNLTHLLSILRDCSRYALRNTRASSFLSTEKVTRGRLAACMRRGKHDQACHERRSTPSCGEPSETFAPGTLPTHTVLCHDVRKTAYLPVESVDPIGEHRPDQQR